MKKVLITGGSGQLGTAISNRFSSTHEVFLGDISLDKDIDGSKFSLDVSNIEEVQEVLEKTDPDILINNAGISVFTDIFNRTQEEIKEVIDVNLKGTINMSNTFAKLNKQNKDNKSIVNIASLYGLISADPRIYTDCSRNSPEVYAATKAGVINLTRYYCVHLRDQNIRVNCVSPGGVINEENPQGDDFISNYSYRCPQKRMAFDYEIANGVYFLASKEASYINGHNLVIDGGFSSW